MIKLILKGFAHDINGSPIVLLTDEKEEKVLPLWIGMIEAQSIALAVEDAEALRPLTHDLFINLCTQLGIMISQVVITDVKDNIFYATIRMETPNGSIEVDARPSDAIALALKSSAPIYLKSELSNNLLSISELVDEETRKEINDIFQHKGFKKVLH